jgi:hypothetical protein
VFLRECASSAILEEDSMHTTWRPRLHPSPLEVVFIVALVVLLAAAVIFVRGVTGLLGVDGDRVLHPLQSLGIR